MLHFTDVLQRFSAAVLIHPEDVDQGVRDCLHAGQRCSGYMVSVKKLARQRVGNFWVDSLDFKRETVTTGWRVDVLLVFVDVMKELPATLVLRPFNSDTLAVVTYQLARDERLGEAALPALTLVLVGLIPVILLSRTLRAR